MEVQSPSFEDELVMSQLDSSNMYQSAVETWPLSKALFGKQDMWVLQKNVVALNSKVVAGRRHIMAGTQNLVRDFMAKRAAAISKEAESGSSKAEEVKARLSTHLPQAMFLRKHASGLTHETFFLPSETDPVILCSISNVPEESVDPISSLVSDLSLTVAPISTIDFDVNKLQVAYDLGQLELIDVEKAVAMRVAAKDCL